MTNPLRNSNHPFLLQLKDKLTGVIKPHYDRTKLIVCVWSENQIVPAKVYCRNLKESSEILVCKDPVKQKDFVIANGDRAIIYNF